MSFCSSCGATLKAEAAFCSKCGAKVLNQFAENTSGNKEVVSSIAPAKESALTDHEWEAFFSSSTGVDKLYKLARSYSRNNKHCVVLTNLQKFRDALGAKYLDFEIALRTYCMGRMVDGWRFHLLDLSSNRLGSSNGDTWVECVSQLRNGVDCLKREGRAIVDAVFIVGDEGIVPMAVFENPTYNPLSNILEIGGMQPYDADVDSDLPFSTLSIKDPIKDNAALEIKASVGRLPSGRLDSGQVAVHYLKNAAQEKNTNRSSFQGFGISTPLWFGSSEFIAQKVKDIHLHKCPEFSLINDSEKLNVDANYFYFKLHGSDNRELWFGDDGSGAQPEALAPHHLQMIEQENVVCSEACYGAKYIGFTPSNSCLKSAFLGNTLAFCGSSRIAWGAACASSKNLVCADVLALRFLLEVKSGRIFGDALSLARNSLLDSDNLNPNDLLTILEFNLFGDPTNAMPVAQTASSSQGNSNAKSSTGGVGMSALSPRNPLSSVRASLQRSSSNLRIRMPDVLSDVKASLDATWEKINARLVEHIYNAEPSLKGVEPQVKLMKLGLARTETLQISVLQKRNNIFIGRAIYADRSGKILSELCPT